MLDFVLVSSIVLSALIVLLLVVGYRLNKKLNELSKQNKSLQDENLYLFRQKKSSEIRLGKIGENMAPFFKDWPYDPNDFKFLGGPIDGLQFNEDGIIFIEIKTGRSRLTNKQITIKNLIKDGKISFATFRIDEEGCKLTLEGATK